MGRYPHMGPRGKSATASKWTTVRHPRRWSYAVKRVAPPPNCGSMLNLTLTARCRASVLYRAVSAFRYTSAPLHRCRCYVPLAGIPLGDLGSLVDGQQAEQ